MTAAYSGAYEIYPPTGSTHRHYIPELKECRLPHLRLGSSWTNLDHQRLLDALVTGSHYKRVCFFDCVLVKVEYTKNTRRGADGHTS